MKSYFSLFRNYANFSGVMKRGAYWTAVCIHMLILLIPLIPGIFYLKEINNVLPAPLDLTAENSMISNIYIPWVLPLWCFYNILMVIPLWSASVRRFHSLPRSGWWLLVGVIPLAGWYLVLSWLLQKGDYDEYMWRLKKAGPATYEEKRRETEGPRNGRWFFVVFLLLAAFGWFLNRQIMRSGSFETALTEIHEHIVSLMKELPSREKPAPANLPESLAEDTPQSILIYVRDKSFDPTPSPTPTPAPTAAPVPTKPIPPNIEIN